MGGGYGCDRACGAGACEEFHKEKEDQIVKYFTRHGKVIVLFYP